MHEKDREPRNKISLYIEQFKNIPTDQLFATFTEALKEASNNQEGEEIRMAMLTVLQRRKEDPYGFRKGSLEDFLANFKKKAAEAKDDATRKHIIYHAQVETGRRRAMFLRQRQEEDERAALIEDRMSDLSHNARLFKRQGTQLRDRMRWGCFWRLCPCCHKWLP